MKQNKWPLIVLFVLCLSFALRADEEAEHVELRKIKTAYEDAVNTKDPQKIAPYLSSAVTGVMITGEEVKGFDGLQAYWKKIQDLIGADGTYHVAVKVDKTEFYGDTTVSRGSTEDVVHLGNGKEFTFTSFWTAVCHKENGAWKVLRLQATMDPVDNVFVVTKLKTTKWIYGGGGLLGGLILAFIFRLSRRQKI